MLNLLTVQRTAKHKITRITTPTSLVTLAATVSLLFSLSSESVFASSVPPAISWTKGYGFGESESHPHAGIELQNGGFVVVGDVWTFLLFLVLRYKVQSSVTKNKNKQKKRTR